MRGTIEITFRNRADVPLTYDVDLSGPGDGASVMDWDIECEDCRRSMRLMPLAPSEEDKILQACVDAAVAKSHDDDFYDPAEWRD
jgi:hypothetical protein